MTAERITGNDILDKAIVTAGFAYDLQQDIFFSRMDAWQRHRGYCRLYDEMAAPFGMIIDCEPVYFEYDGKKWLIELWKGQYDLTTGGEVGVYVTEAPDLNVPGIFNGIFYRCAGDEDLLSISFSLEKNDKTLLVRDDRHWWLTGFKLGEFSDPSELKMKVLIALKDEMMCEAFVEGLEKTGYSKSEIVVRGNTVGLEFAETRTRQPSTRTPETDRIIQMKNKLLCDKYLEITGPYDNFPDKMKAIQDKAAELLDKVINIGKPKQLFDMYEKIKDYLE